MLIILIFYTLLGNVGKENQLKYPPNVKCDAITSNFGVLKDFKDNKWTEKQMFEYRKWALIDKEFTLKRIGAGYYQCWCESQTNSLSKAL